MEKSNYRILTKEYKNTDPAYYAQVRHPWFKFWCYLGKYTDRLFFSDLNDRQLVYNSLDEAYLRIEDHKIKMIRIKELYKIYPCKKICKYL